MTAQLADGRTLSFPDGTDPAVIQATVKKVIASSQPEEDPTSGRNLFGAATEPLLHLATGAVAGPIAGLAGMAAPLTNALGVTHTAPADVVRKVAEMATYRPHTTGGKNATEAITYPLQLLAEGADRAGGAVSDVTGSPMLGAGVNTAIQAIPMVLGMKGGAASEAPKTPVPLVGGTVSALYRTLVEPRLSEGAAQLLSGNPGSGPADILSRYQRGLAGDAKSQIVDALMQAQELVPGSKPTAAEALAGIPDASPLAAHQKSVSKSAQASGDFIQRSQDQAGARNAALDTIAQTPEALKAAIDNRAQQASQDYGSAFYSERGGIPTLPTGLGELQKNPFFQKALPDADTLAAARGITKENNLTEYMHLVKLSLDKMISKTGDSALSRTEQGEVQSVKDRLSSWMEQNNAQYQEARANFAQASGPINQMQIGQFLSDKLNSPLDRETPGSFAAAVRDAPGTIKRAAGGPRFDSLSDVLTPEQQAVVDALQGDLTRRDAAGQLANGTTLTSSPLDTTVVLPHMLSRPVTLINQALHIIKGGAEPKINELAAEQYLDPVKLADSLTRQTTQEAIIEALLRARNPAILAGAAAAGER